MEMKYFSIKEVKKHRVSIKHIIIDPMIFYALTKGLPSKLFASHVKNKEIMSTNEC